MKCINCNKEIEKDSKFCVYCGFGVNVVDVKKEIQEFLGFMEKVEKFRDIDYQCIEDDIKERIGKLKSLYCETSKVKPPKAAKKGYDYYLNSISKKIQADEAFNSSDYEKNIKYLDDSDEEEDKADDEFIKLAESYYKISQKLEPKTKDFIEISKELLRIAEDYFGTTINENNTNDEFGEDPFQLYHKTKKMDDCNDDYNRELKEWNDYVDEWTNNVFPLLEELNSLGNKRIEVAEASDSRKLDSYMELEVDKCKEIIDVMHEMHVPEIAEDMHNYETNHYIKRKQSLKYALQTSIHDYDDTKVQKLYDETTQFATRAEQENKRIAAYFNQRAKELGLQVPYPEFE